jgi:hypothetical protein
MADEPRRDEGFQATARIGRDGSTRGPLAASAVVAALLVIAIVKPWNPGPAPTPRPTSPAVAEVASLAPVPSTPASPDSSAPAVPAGHVSSQALVDAASDRLIWGMRAIVQSRRGVLAGPLLAERWASAPVPATGPAIPGAFDDTPLDGPLGDVADAAYALAVTTPPDAMPLDVRFWRTSEDRGWVRLLPLPIAGREPGSWLWRPDPTWSTVDGTWPSGTYRVDVLLGPRIVRLEAVLAGTFRADPRVIVPGGLDAPIAAALETMPPGPFALTEYGPAAIPLAATGRFDELAAWLAPYLGTGFVAPAYGQSVNGLGVRFGAGAAPANLAIQQLSGVPQPSTVGVDLSTVQAGDGSGDAVFARPLGGHLFTDALYRIVAEWPDGRRQDWEVEVTPGPTPQVPMSPLEALSRWESARGSADPALPVVTVDAPGGNPMSSATCQPRTRISAADGLVGVALPDGAHLTGVSVLVLAGDRTPDSRFHFAADAVAGLTVVAVPYGGLPAGDYDLVLDLDGPDGRWRMLQRVCVVD